jgi:hypothetical protein
MNKKLLARFCGFWFIGYLLVSQIWGQEGVHSKQLTDGVKYYYRIGATETKPWFFQQVENLLDVIIPDKTKLPFGKSVAFLVGVSDYKFFATQLSFVKNDIEDMRYFLLTQGGFDEVYVAQEGIVDRDLIDKYMKGVFRNQLSPNDRLLFYYAGHGADLEGETGYMQFSQARSSEFYGKNVMKISDATDWCSEVKLKHLLIIFDCCASGLAIKSRSSNPKEEQAQMIATLSKNGSRAIITAGTATEKTFEVKSANGRGNGVFTRAFLNAVTTGRADQGKDGFITIDEIMAQLKNEVAYFAQRYKQNVTPQIWPLLVETYGGTFVFLNPEAKNQNCKIPEAYLAPMAAIVSRGELVAEKGILRLTAFATGKLWIDNWEADDIESGDVKEYALLVGKHLIEIRNQSQPVKQEVEVKKGITTPLTLRLVQKQETPISKPKEEKKPLVTEQPRVIQTPVFHSAPRSLSKDQVKAMLKEFNFYCSEYSWTKGFSNPGGAGFANDFQIINNQLVYDRASGLLWQRGGSEKYLYWNQVQAYIDSLNQIKFGGYNGWRLPTLEEAMSLMKRNQNSAGLNISDFFDSQQRWIWTADPHAGASGRWVVSFYRGYCCLSPDISYSPMRAVRFGQSPGE